MVALSSIAPLLTLSLLVGATPPPPPPPHTVTVTAPPSPTATRPASQCNVKGLQCCNSVQMSNSAGVAPLLALVGVVLHGLAVPVGVTCSPINVLGIGAGGRCTAQPVCCSNNNFHGVIAIGCTPVNIGL